MEDICDQTQARYIFVHFLFRVRSFVRTRELPPNVDKLIAAELIKEYNTFYEGFVNMSIAELSLRMYEIRGWSSSRRRDAGGRASIGTYTRGGKIDSDIFKEKRLPLLLASIFRS